jgi:3-oxo-5-alpha-steroid 4-dehydrogenase 1
MSPIHGFVWFSALVFQFFNATCIGGYLAGHGPLTTADWSGGLYRAQIGLIIFFLGLFGNIFHDDDLREIRRSAMRRQKAEAEKKAKEEGKPVEEVSVDKVYMLPKNGLFHFVLFPHYLCEWIEWAGFWMVGGWACVPARCFLINEVCSMLPRALQGYKWYVKKFGADKVGNRKAVIPGIL